MYLPESLGRTSTLQASLVVSEMVEPYGSSRTEPGPTHSKVPSMFSAAAPEGAQRLSVNLSLISRTVTSSQKHFFFSCFFKNIHEFLRHHLDSYDVRVLQWLSSYTWATFESDLTYGSSKHMQIYILHDLTGKQNVLIKKLTTSETFS